MAELICGLIGFVVGAIVICLISVSSNKISEDIARKIIMSGFKLAGEVEKFIDEDGAITDEGMRKALMDFKMELIEF